VHEHAGEDRVHLLHGVGREAAGDEGPLLDKRLPGIQLDEKDEDIQRDKRQGDDRKRASL